MAGKKKKQSASKKTRENRIRWVAVSGGFDPLHVGHVRLLKEARRLGDKLVVILNNDQWLANKKGFVFMPESERVELLRSFPFVDKVIVSKHKRNVSSVAERGVSRELARLKPAVFANGGDRDKKNSTNPNSPLYWDIKTCKELGIQMVFNVGRGGKVQSSSWMVKDAVRGIARCVRPWGEFYQWDKGKGWNLRTLVIKPGEGVGMQYHKSREEWWMLAEGDARYEIIKNGRTKKGSLKKGELMKVSRGAAHRLLSRKGGRVIEVAFGSFNDADIVRLEGERGRRPL